MKATSGYIHNYGSKTPINIDIDEEFASVMLAKVEDLIVENAIDREFDQLTELVETRDQLMEAKKEFENKCKFAVREEEPDGEDE